MTLPDLDPEDKLIFPEGSGTATNLFTHIPGGAVTVGVLVLTAVAVLRPRARALQALQQVLRAHRVT
jgi:hypothetical protein